MQNLKYVNANGVELDLTSGNYGITDWSGLSNADLNIQTQQVPYEDGAVFIDALLNTRDISVTVAINDNNNLTTRYELKRELIAALNPKLGEGYLYYKNDYLERRIKVIPQLPIFENKNSNDSGTLKASVTWTACGVYWEDVEETVVNIDNGIRTNIINNGDVPCSVKMESFLSNIKNLKIENITNNKSITLNGTFNDYISIDTNVGQKSVAKDKLIFKAVSSSYYINDIAYSSKRKIYVAISYGYILISEDKINWSIINPDIYFPSLYSICYNEDNDIFVAVGKNGYIITSNDGYNWTIRNSSGSDARTLNKVIYIDNSTYQGFVAVGADVAISSDGITWTITNNVFSYFMYSIAYSDNFIVVVGGENTVCAWCRGVISSRDISWGSTNTTDDNLGLYSVCYSSYTRCFVAVGNGGLIKVSDSNVTTWNSLHPSPLFSGWIQSIEFINEYKMFVGVTYDGRAVYSEDSINWTIYSFYDDINQLQGLKYFEKTGEVIIYGTYLLKTDFLKKIVVESNWEYLINNLNEKFNDVCFGQNKYVFACYNKIIYSSDLVNFTKIEFNDNHTFDKIVYCKNLNKFIALTNNEGYAVSSNAVDWEFFTSVSGVQLICNDDIIIIRSSTTCYVSNDAINWKTSTITTDANYRVVSIAIDDNHGCVAVGLDISSHNKAVMFYNLSDSDLNFTWYKSDFSDSTASAPSDVCYSSKKNIFVSCSVWDVFYVSYDRIHWIRPMVLGGQSGGISIIYNDFYNLFFSFNGNILYISSDGYNWYKYDLFNRAVSFNSFKTIGDKIFLIGTDANIYVSDFTFNENIISSLSTNSNIDLNLEVGNNTFLLTSDDGEYNIKLTYRQKYVGV